MKNKYSYSNSPISLLLTLVFFITSTSLSLLSGCTNSSGKSVAEEKSDQSVQYQTYCNERYGYCVDYPDFLIPQGESDNGDGQQFISENDEQKLWVYRDAKMDMMTGDLLSLRQAYQDDCQSKLEVTKKELFDNYYFIKGKTSEKSTFSQYSILVNNDYFTIYFEYPHRDDKLFNGIGKKVSGSFNIGMNIESRDEFPTFLFHFLNECFYENNFNRLLHDKSDRLAPYIDKEMGVQRYYALGTIPKLFSRSDNFGFDEHTDFETKPEAGGEYSLLYLDTDTMICDLDFDGYSKLYYHSTDKVPDIVINFETFEMAPVQLPYQDAAIMVVYLPNRFNNPRAFYFIETPSGWKLAFVDDTLCGG